MKGDNMRKIGKAVAALTLATGAALGLSLSMPASAHGGSLISIGNVDVTAVDLSGNQIVLLQNVSVTDAANFCQVNVDVLTAQLLSGDKAACTSKTNEHQQASVSRHK
jgi:hypothetical protein